MTTRIAQALCPMALEGPARVKKDGAGTVPARKLLDSVRLLPEGDVNMKFLGTYRAWR